MRRAYKYRLSPNKGQSYNLVGMLITLRRLYNTALEQRKSAWENEQRSIKFADQSRWFTEARKTDPYFAQINRNAAQSILKRLDKAFAAFFRRVKEYKAAVARGKKPETKPGYPRFKGRDRFNSIEFLTPNNGYKIVGEKGDRIRVQGVGTVRIKLHRPMEGRLKSVVLKHEAGKWYVVLSCDLGDLPAPEPSVNSPVGIDVGLTSFLTTTDGEHVANPRFLKQELPEIRRLSRKIADRSRQKKPRRRQYMKMGGKNRAKAKARLQKAHARVKNLRREFHHQEALKLVCRYGLIALEELDIRGMLEDRGVQGKSKCQRFSRSISDAAWGGFASTLSCKAERAGVTIVRVDPRGTTQECSGCGQVVPKTIRDRWHECPHCGLSLDRDENAARNILSRALPGWTGPAGLNSGVTLSGPRNSALSSPVLAVKDPVPSSSRTRKFRRKPLEGNAAAPLTSDSGSMNEPPALVHKKLRSKLPASGDKGKVGGRGSMNRAVQLMLWEDFEDRPCETAETGVE
jgi:putative transposase